jgi:GNAT superfamily N-acetyltransferase
MTIREATTADLETILEQRRRACEDMGYRDPAVFEAVVDRTREPLRRWLEDGTYRGWLVERDGVVVAGGGVVITPWLPNMSDPGGRRATVLNVYTARGHRRQGLARALMETMLAWCRAEGFDGVLLDTSDEARSLYASLGFRPTTAQMRLPLPRTEKARG